MSEYQSKSELYAANQRLFDETFAVMMVKTWVGFERGVFEQLAQNDDMPPVSLPMPPDDGIEEEDDLPEGTSLYWADGTPLPVDPEEHGHA